MITVSNELFKQIEDNLYPEFDVYLGTFGLKSETKDFDFDVYYEEEDIVKNQFVISPSKVKIEFYSEVLPYEDMEFTPEQSKTMIKWLKDLYEGAYLEAKDERENPKSPFCYERYSREMDIVTSDWYSL